MSASSPLPDVYTPERRYYAFSRFLRQSVAALSWP
jgi:hypothetical protein